MHFAFWSVDDENRQYHEWFSLKLYNDFIQYLQEFGLPPLTSTVDYMQEMRQAVENRNKCEELKKASDDAASIEQNDL